MKRNQFSTQKQSRNARDRKNSSQKRSSDSLTENNRDTEIEAFCDSIKTRIAFFVDSDETKLAFEAMNSFQRRLIHKIAKDCQLDSESQGDHKDRHVCLIKNTDSLRPELSNQRLWDFGIRTISIAPSTNGIPIVLLADGTIEVQSEHSKNIIDARKVHSRQIRVRKGRILEPGESGWDKA